MQLVYDYANGRFFLSFSRCVLIPGFDDRWQTEGGMPFLSGILHGPISAGRAENYQFEGKFF